MQVCESMSSPAVTIGPDTTLHDAIGTMLQHRIGSVIVVDSGPIGILTRSDVLRIAYFTENPLTEQQASEGMSKDLITIVQTSSVETALGTMEEHGIKKLPVMHNLELIGIITMTDIARYQPEHAREVRNRLERKDEWTIDE